MDRPNIVFITCHDLGKHLGCYGQQTVQSPHLDRLAAEGVRFDGAFCTSPLCSPSRSALHTGRYSHSNGVMGLTHAHFGWRLKRGEKHAAQLLREEGYAAALFGVQHVAEEASELGYEHAAPIEPAAVLGAQAAEWIRSRQGAAQPFYLEVGFFEPHRPYDWRGTRPDDSKGAAIPPYLPVSREAQADTAALQGMIRQMDLGVGMVLEALEAAGLSEDTWVIFTTDHGLAMPRAKSTLYDAGIEVALLMRWPRRGIAGGKRLAGLVSQVDVLPTMLEALALEAGPLELQGESFWTMLQEDDSQGRQAVFAEKNYHARYEPMRCIRTERYKLIVNLEVSLQVDVPSDIVRSPVYPLMVDDLSRPRPAVELYDLLEDPLEMDNLAESPSHARLRAELTDRLLRWMQETEDPILHGPVSSPYYDDALHALTSAVAREGDGG
ncbi:sulfatase [Paenibacillus sp. 1P07SE]|uniref:sulfatase family protein n=1 Tax=Paenibacillus sp. 1P07SE TaxID=3132209 RepID=UPI0039A45A86